MIGKTLGHYRILDRLGAGGMGVVWLAEDVKLGRKVALKTLREDLAGSPEKRARFEREAMAVAALNHPNIVTLYAVEEADGARFLTMEHVDGTTLDDVIVIGGLPPAEVARIGRDVAAALAAAHEPGIVHRDLKPGNILVGKDRRIKVVDFGLARALRGDAGPLGHISGNTSLTVEGLAVGTLHYMSPEQLQNKPVDERSDLFALGVVLYEMATGEMPFPGESAAQVITSMMRDKPRRLDGSDPRLPPLLVELIASLLAKDPAERPQSAAGVRDTLDRLARRHDSETEALPSAAARRSWQPAIATAGVDRRRFWSWAIAGAALVAAVVAAGLFGRGLADRAHAIPAVAVLPVVSFGGEPDYFVDGTTDGLIGALGRFEGLRVISRQSAMHYKGSRMRLPEIADELGVDYVVEASVARDGERLRLQAQIVRAQPEQQVWSQAFERPGSGVLALHNEVATAVARALRARVSESEEVRMAAAREVDPAAYEAYLRGRQLLEQLRPETVRKARELFEEAIRIDPKFALAHSGLADVHWMLANFFDDPSIHALLHERSARDALEIDPDLAAAHAQIGDARSYHHWDWTGAEAAYRRAIELEPNNAYAHRKYWGLLTILGRFREARTEIETAIRLDPRQPTVELNYGELEFIEGNLEEARRHFRRALELDPQFPWAYAWLWGVADYENREPERTEALRALLAGIGFPEAVAEMDRLPEDASYRDKSLRAGRYLSEVAATRRVPTGTHIYLLVSAGDLDGAEKLMLEAFERRSPQVLWLAVNPGYVELRERPAIRKLIDEMSLPHLPSPLRRGSNEN